MAWTTTGNVSVTNNNAIVYGSGTSWSSSNLVRGGDIFKAPDGKDYQVLSVQSNTQLTLASVYLGTTASGQAYALIHTGLLPAELAVDVSDLQSKYLTTVAQLYEWETSAEPTVPLTNPATGITTNVKPIAQMIEDMATPTITGGTINGAPIGQSVAAAGSFTTLSATGSATFGAYATVGTAAGDVFYADSNNTAVKAKTAGGAIYLQSSAGVTQAVSSSTGFSVTGTLTTNGIKEDAAGNVGIGVSPSAWRSNPDKTLQVNGAAFTGYGSYAASLSNNAFLDASSLWRYIESGVVPGKFDLLNNGGFAWSSAPSGTAGQPFTFTQDMTLVNGNLLPGANGTQNLGSASLRWSTVYAATGTINTSDAREKTIVRPLSLGEIEAAKQIGKEIGAYQWLSSIAQKGDSAREHIGLTVQRAIEIMYANDLDPMVYGFICYDKWDDAFIEHPAVDEVAPRPAVLDENGIVVEPEVVGVEAKAAWTEQTQVAGDRYAFRYDELNLFIAKGLEARISELESK